MGAHDEYGKQVMIRAIGVDYRDWGTCVQVDYGYGQPARIDGTAGDNIAIEIESRVSKQVRGAVLDLICHRYPKKLLVLLPVHMSDVQVTASQCRHIMSRFLEQSDFRVVVLEGNGNLAATASDAKRIMKALSEVGYSGKAPGT